MSDIRKDAVAEQKFLSDYDRFQGKLLERMKHLNEIKWADLDDRERRIETKNFRNYATNLYFTNLESDERSEGALGIDDILGTYENNPGVYTSLTKTWIEQNNSFSLINRQGILSRTEGGGLPLSITDIENDEIRNIVTGQYENYEGIVSNISKLKDDSNYLILQDLESAQATITDLVASISTEASLFSESPMFDNSMRNSGWDVRSKHIYMNDKQFIDKDMHHYCVQYFAFKPLYTDVNEFKNVEADNEAIESWLHQEGEHDDLPFEVPDENMTPEQRAIQWAINRGGAQNL